MKYIIAHDLGTSGNKATLFSTEGQLIRNTTYAYDVHYFNDCWAEQNPEDWWIAVCQTTKTLLANINKEDVIAVSFSAHMMGCLPVDQTGKALRPAIIWADGRATKEAAQVAAQISPQDFFHICGHRLSANYTLSKIMWLMNNEPQIYQQTYKFLQAKDYIVHRLCGKMMTDYSDASGTNMFDLNTFTWSQRILSISGIDPQKLPTLAPSTTIAGNVLPSVSAECGLSASTQVVLGGGDGMCASVGAGSIKEGKTYSCLGTSAWIATASRKPIYDEQMILCNWAHVVPGYIVSLGTMQSAGASFSWAKNTLCAYESWQAKELGQSVYNCINERIEVSPAGSNGILFLPYLMGERSPRWNPNAKGCFIGLKITNTHADLMRSVIEGIGYNLRVILEALIENGIQIPYIDLVGGIARGNIQRKIFSDIWERPVRTLNFLEEAGSIGAAVIAGVGVGVFESFEEVSRFIHVTDIIEPDQSNTKIYNRYYSIFNQTYTSLVSVFDVLNSF